MLDSLKEELSILSEIPIIEDNLKYFKSDYLLPLGCAGISYIIKRLLTRKER